MLNIGFLQQIKSDDIVSPSVKVLIKVTEIAAPSHKEEVIQVQDIKFPFEEHLLQMKEYEQEVIWIKGRPFIVQPATNDDIERINKGYFCMD